MLQKSQKKSANAENQTLFIGKKTFSVFTNQPTPPHVSPQIQKNAPCKNS